MIVHEVITTEKVPIRFRVAGVGSRFLAMLADFVLLLLLGFAGVMVAGVLELGRPGLGQAVFMLWMFAELYGYFLLFEWLWHGQTPGKWLMGIRVISWDGTGIAFWQSAVRNILRAADGLPFPFLLYGLAVAVAGYNRENRRLGDLAGGTLVVHVERGAKPLVMALGSGTAADRAWQAQVRQRLTQLDRQQKQVLLDLVLRRDQLRVADRAKLFQAASDFLQGRLALAPEQYQSDEKFVLALAAELSETKP